ncbi:hypothetical protein MRB53_020961 [Persea americana]|uniref:Uncharacterized protein n=1 Tax=Persea americana TaxID=3435 RepID=A0ACC2L2E4_PERAE|nr:hypothetical protein MRB53_020961 [Persea americana]
MKTGEKQQKFHEAFMKIFFPPQPIQQTPQQQVEDEPVVFVREGSDANSGSDYDNVEERNALADASDCMSDKLTRSQRKRIRRRKLKEAASRRRKIIGPLLPSTDEDTKGEPSNLEKEKQLHEDSCIDKPGHIDC